MSAISLIAAVDKNWLLGSEMKLPWHLPAELKLFRRLTLNKPVVMGRKTFKSLKKPLEQRKNIVLSNDDDFHPRGCHTVSSIEEALQIAGNSSEIMIIGGATVYRQFLPRAGKIYLSVINATFEGDVYFPDINMENWRQEIILKKQPDKENPWAFKTYKFIRKAEK